jgi:hypothetical protein
MIQKCAGRRVGGEGVGAFEKLRNSRNSYPRLLLLERQAHLKHGVAGGRLDADRSLMVTNDALNDIES